MRVKSWDIVAGAAASNAVASSRKARRRGVKPTGRAGPKRWSESAGRDPRTSLRSRERLAREGGNAARSRSAS